MKFNIKGLQKTVKRAIGVTKVKLNQKAPEIAIISGVGAMFGGTFIACKVTLKLDDILSEHNETLEKVETAAETMPEKYSQEDKEHDIKIVRIQTGVKIVKAYLPAALMMIGGATSILVGNSMHKKRAATLTASLAAMTESFREYRKRVAERYGEDAERRIRFNLKEEKIEETEVDPETGKEKKVKKKVDVLDGDPGKYSPYAVIFDPASREWSKDPDQNFLFLRAQQKLANAKLISQGYLFLNEVYAALDIPETKEGHQVGWIYDPKLGKDNFIDFGIYDVRKEPVRDFQNGYERNIILDFNVDGPIVDKIKYWGRN